MRLIHNSNLCIGCRACQQACQDYHNLPAGKKLMSIIEDESLKNGSVSVTYRLQTCLQCINGHCMQVCPSGAISKTKQDITIVDAENCIGCGKCTTACPIGAIKIKYTDMGTKAVKCILCMERGENQPICVQACPLQCINLI